MAGDVTGDVLGIDVGTTYTAAAVAVRGEVSMLSLGSDRAAVPTVVVLREDGEVLVGEAAERRAANQPDRTAREFKRRVGDPVPMVVGGTPYSAESLVAQVLRWVAAEATARRGTAPAAIALAHPASWSTYKTELLRHAAQQAGLADVTLITEPQAAAVHYASEAGLADGATVAVYDLGGGTFDAAVVRRVGDGWELMGVPEGLERFGGIDLDQAVFAHVDRSLDGMLGELDTSDPATRSGLVRLREECRRAKEALSTDTDTVVPVVLPTLTTDVRVTRAELESMARPRIAETVAALQRGVASAGLTAGDLDRVLLVGGSSRMPLVAEMVHQTLGVPVVADANPKLAIAYGAALAGAAARATGAAGPGAARATAPDQDPTTPAIVPAASPSPAPQPPTVGDDRGDGGRTDPAGRTPPRRMLVPAAVALLVLALAGGAVALTRPDAEPTGSERLAAGSSTASTTGATDGTTTTTRSSASTTTATPSSTTGTTAVPTTSPPVTSPPTTAPPATLTRERMTDASGSLSAEVPIAWQSRLTNAVQLNGVLAVQVSAAADQAGYAAFTSPGVTVLAADAAQADPPDQVLALIGGSFTGTCQAQPVASFSTAVMSGVTQRWTGCGGGVSTAHVHVGTSSTGDIYLVSGVTLGLADEVAYQRAVETAVRR